MKAKIAVIIVAAGKGTRMDQTTLVPDILVEQAEALEAALEFFAHNQPEPISSAP